MLWLINLPPSVLKMMYLTSSQCFLYVNSSFPVSISQRIIVLSSEELAILNEIATTINSTLEVEKINEADAF